MKLIPGRADRTWNLMLDLSQYGLLFGPVRRAIVEPGSIRRDELLQMLICHYGRQLWHAGLIGGSAGNLSARSRDPDIIYVTPRATNKSRLAPSEVRPVRLTDRGAALAGVSVEFPMHRACYEARPEVRAVLHTHAPALTALGIRGELFGDLLPEASDTVGGVCIVPQAPSGSERLATNVGTAVGQGYGVIIIERHGVVTVGARLSAAYDRVELAELSARTILMAKG